MIKAACMLAEMEEFRIFLSRHIYFLGQNIKNIKKYFFTQINLQMRAHYVNFEDAIKKKLKLNNVSLNTYEEKKSQIANMIITLRREKKLEIVFLFKKY